MSRIDAVDGIHIVTNEKFYRILDWKKKATMIFRLPYNDGTTSNDDRLGALGDLKFVLDQAGISDDIVLAGDNLMDFLRGFL